MKKLLSILCALLILLTAATAETADVYSVSPDVSIEATGNVHIRREPHLGTEDMGVLEKGDSLPFAADVSVDERGIAWYKADYNGEEGWISSRYSMLTDGTVDGMEYDPLLCDCELYLLNDVTLAIDPVKGIGAVNVEAHETVFATGYSYCPAKEDTYYLVQYDGEYGWVNGLCVSFPTAE